MLETQLWICWFILLCENRLPLVYHVPSYQYMYRFGKVRIWYHADDIHCLLCTVLFIVYAPTVYLPKEGLLCISLLAAASGCWLRRTRPWSSWRSPSATKLCRPSSVAHRDSSSFLAWGGNTLYGLLIDNISQLGLTHQKNWEVQKQKMFCVPCISPFSIFIRNKKDIKVNLMSVKARGGGRMDPSVAASCLYLNWWEPSGSAQ